jgi:hypothetical protein
MWIFEVVPHIVCFCKIIMFICGMFDQTSFFAQWSWCYHIFGSCLWDSFLVRFFSNVSFNLFPRNHLCKVILSLLCVIVWRFEATKNLSKHGVLILIFFICFFVVKMILGLCVNYHWEITPNTSCPWKIGTLSCGIYIYIFMIFTLAIAFNFLISRQEMYLI